MPSEVDLVDARDEAVEWMGRARAIMSRCPEKHEFAIELNLFIASTIASSIHAHYTKLRVLIRQAADHLRYEISGPLNVAIGKDMVFDYHNNLRKIIEGANADILFVDPYLDSDFVSDYLPYVSGGVAVRLLTNKKLETLIPSVKKFAAQHGTKLEVRSHPHLHDRFVFIDKAGCYHSGASFKDGARNAPTTMTQIVDAFDKMLETYEGFWTGAKVVHSS